MKDQTAPGAGRVDQFGQRLEPAVPVMESLDNLNQVFKRTRQSIQLPDGENIALPQRT
jgi:hypothetical protein